MQQTISNLFIKYLNAVSLYISKKDSAAVGQVYLGGSGYGLLKGYHDSQPQDLDLQYNVVPSHRYPLAKIDQLSRGPIVITKPVTQITLSIYVAHPVDQFVQAFKYTDMSKAKYEKWIYWFIDYLSKEEQQEVLDRLDDTNSNKLLILEKMGDKNGRNSN